MPRYTFTTQLEFTVDADSEADAYETLDESGLYRTLDESGPASAFPDMSDELDATAVSYVGRSEFELIPSDPD